MKLLLEITICGHRCPKLRNPDAKLVVEARNGISYLQPQYGIREFTYEPGNRTFYTPETWNSPRKVWEYVAQNCLLDRPSWSSTTSPSPTTTASDAISSTEPTVTSPTYTGTPTADISTSVAILTKTIVDTICEGGSVTFETKTYSGPFTQSYLVRPSSAVFVEVDVGAWPASDDIIIADTTETVGSGQGSQNSGETWYFDASGQRQWGQPDEGGFSILVIEEVEVIIEEIETVVPTPGIVVINVIRYNVEIAPATVTYSTTGTQKGYYTQTATATSGWPSSARSLSPSSRAPTSASFDPNMFLNSASFNGTQNNGTTNGTTFDVSDFMRKK